MIADSKTEYYYTSPSTGIEDRSTNLLCEIPNPIRSGQRYSCSALHPDMTYQLQLYDMAGRQLQQQSFRGSETFSVETYLSKGMYLMFIRQEKDVVYWRKILVE